MLHTLALVNESTVVEDAELKQIARALQHQINHDFAPHWFTNGNVVAVPKGQKADAAHWWIVIADDVEEAGALGYHDLTPDLKPVAIVGAKTDLEYDAKVSVTISHEALEMLGDPYIMLTAEDPVAGRLYAYETADAVEADDLGYDVFGVTLSDFVFPTYFQTEFRGKSQQMSFRGNVSQPFELATGGYLSYREIGDSKWKQETKQEAAADPQQRQHAQRHPGFPPGSRRERRIRRSQAALKVSDHALSPGHGGGRAALRVVQGGKDC
jgi:hypothetical protein